MKSEFTFFQSLSWLFQPSLTLSNATELFWSWISIDHIQVHKEKYNFVIACLRPSQNVKLYRHFHAVFVQWRQRNVQKSVMHVQSCFFALSSYSFFYFLVAAASYTWYYLRYVVIRQKQNFLSANWIAPADSIRNVFRLICSSFVSCLETWWTNRATVAR